MKVDTPFGVVELREVRRAPIGGAYFIHCGVDTSERDRTRRHHGTVRRMLGMPLSLEDRCDRDADATGVP